MRFTFAQAEAFYWTARLGGFRSAATKLNLSQPTVSLRVQELERILGGKLFDRAPYRPTLMPLGRTIFDDVERMLRIADGVQDSARPPAMRRGLTRIGAADTFAARVLPTLLGRLARQHPAWQVDIIVESSMRLEALLMDRQVDIAFMSQPRLQPGTRVAALWPIELVWVAGRALGLEDTTVTPADLAELPIFTNPAPSPLYSTIQCWFAEGGVAPRRLNTCNPLHVIARLASAGTGVALLPTEVIEDCPERDELCVLQADPPVPGHQLCAVWWANEDEGECAVLADLAREIGGARALPASPVRGTVPA